MRNTLESSAKIAGLHDEIRLWNPPSTKYIKYYILMVGDRFWLKIFHSNIRMVPSNRPRPGFHLQIQQLSRRFQCGVFNNIRINHPTKYYIASYINQYLRTAFVTVCWSKKLSHQFLAECCWFSMDIINHPPFGLSSCHWPREGPWVHFNIL
jgi:hypothetical protein